MSYIHLSYDWIEIIGTNGNASGKQDGNRDSGLKVNSDRIS
jgi:hypothetical protein